MILCISILPLVEEERTGEAMRMEEPYFMKNPEWYSFDEKEFKYVLTDKATDEAKKSYDEFYDTLEGIVVEG